MAVGAPRGSDVAARVAAALEREGIHGTHLLVAVSGGVDSSVLLHALARLAPEHVLELSVGHVHHGLRGAEADADQAAVEEQASALGLRFRATHVDPKALQQDVPSRARPTLQEAARRVRHDALREMAGWLGAKHVVTAHTLDDQAETVLLRLLRGAGPDGLGGIAPRSPDGFLLRPLLDVSRAEIEDWARREGIAWREDPSNGDPRFARARLRTGGLPALAAQINPNWLRAIGDLAEAQRTDAAWMTREVERASARLLRREEGALWIERDGLLALPDALARRVARQALRSAGASRDVSRTHLRRMLDFLGNGRPGSSIEFPAGVMLRCTNEGFFLHSGSGPRGVQLPRQC
ncbi:MAG: tRNA lysidine(34) synthetase TilS [Myxococcota bacterium]|nr:tRNA lysidine(34) synthetase TilS [Myxococcota bacterium]